LISFNKIFLLTYAKLDKKLNKINGLEKLYRKKTSPHFCTHRKKQQVRDFFRITGEKVRVLENVAI